MSFAGLQGFSVHLPLSLRFSSHLAQFLEFFQLANAGSHKHNLILSRYSRLLGVKAEKEYYKHLARNELAWRAKLRSRPIMTGGYLRPSVSNPPLPRLSPQPVAMTRIIGKRRRVRTRRILKLGGLQEMLCDVTREAEFEEGLANMGCAFEPVFAGE